MRRLRQTPSGSQVFFFKLNPSTTVFGNLLECLSVTTNHDEALFFPLRPSVIRKLILLGILCFSWSAVFPQLTFDNPVRITTEEGLPDNRVLCMEQDEFGFMWFGTYDGLCRYDGSSTKVFKNIPGDTSSLSTNLIKSLYYDKEYQQMWIGTQKGLNVLDVNTGKIRQYWHDPERARSLPEDNISYPIIKDREGELWIGLNKKGLARYNSATEDFDHFTFQVKGKESEERLHMMNYIRDICQDLKNDSILWLGSEYGILKFNKYTCKFQHYFNRSLKERLQQTANKIRNIYPLPDGRMLLGGWGNFLTIFDPLTSTFSSTLATLQPDRFPAGEGLIYSILKKSNTEVWASTREGLVIFNHEQEKIVSERLNDPATDSYYRATLMDNRGRIWGMFRHGVEYYDPLNEQFRHHPLTSAQKKAFFIVSKVLPGLNKDKLFVTLLQGEGIYQLDRNTGEWSVLLPPPSFRKNSFPHAWRDLIYLQDGTLLIVEENTLFTLSKNADQIIPYPFQPKLDWPRYMNAMQDSQGHVWIPSINSGLIRLDLKDRTFKIFHDEFLEEEEKGTKIRVSSVFEDRFQNLWFAVSNGFSVFDRQQERFYNFRHQPGKSNTFNFVVNILEDEQGRILISGGENGLGIADPRHPEKGIIGKLDIGESLTPQGIIKDKNDDLWFSDNKNLKRIDLVDSTLEYFDGYDGLADDDENKEVVPINGLQVLPSGEIAVCYSRGLGLSIFHPDSLRKNQELPRPHLTSFATFDQALALDTALFFNREITLPYDQNFFSFEFSAIGFTQAHQNTFKYQLEGLDPDWIYPSADRRYASYSKVREGHYRLRIMAANNEGVWNPEPYTLQIRILPPWYRSMGAYVLYTVLLLGLGWMIYRFLKRRWALQLQVQVERAEAERFKELNEFKSRFFSNITHEFRTPLTVIQGLTQEIEQDPSTKLPKRLQLIRKNGDELLKLVNQLLDLARLDVGKLQIKMVRDDVIGFVRMLVDSFHSYAVTQKIGLQFYSELDQFEMDFDPNLLQSILSNLLSNAFRHTPEFGTVLVVAKVIESRGQEQLEIKVKDSGAGIAAEKLPYVFDRFYTFSPQQQGEGEGPVQQGIGIGLALVKELIELMGGQIFVKSQVGKGTTFTFILPVTRLASSPEAPARPEVQTAWIPNSVEGPDTEVVSMVEDENEDQPLALLIEDNADVLYYLQTCLGEAWRIEACQNGKAGVDKALELIPDVIISDVMMPGMDGFEVVKKLKADERTSHIPILMLTAKATQADKLEGLAKGADAYLVKPFDKKELLLRLENFLQMRTRLQTYLQGNEQSNKTNPEQQFLKKINHFILEHLDENSFDSHYLAREVGMSRSQLSRKVKALTGQSLSRYMRSFRLKQARQKLETTDLNVSEVAWMTGFESLSWFNQAYQEEFGESPGESRK